MTSARSRSAARAERITQPRRHAFGLRPRGDKEEAPGAGGVRIGGKRLSGRATVNHLVLDAIAMHASEHAPDWPFV